MSTSAVQTCEPMSRFARRVPSVAMVAELAAVDVADPSTDLLDVVAGWERVKAWAEAAQTDALAALDAAAGEPARDEFVDEELGLLLGISGGSAARRLQSATDLTVKLPQTLTALRGGAVSTHHARLATSAVSVLDDDVARAVEGRVLGAGPSEPGGVVDVLGLPADTRVRPDRWRTPAQFARTWADAVIDADPEGAADRHRAALARRTARFRDELDGIVTLWAQFDAPDGQLAAAAVEAHARSVQARRHDGSDDRRTLDQLRADVLRDLILGDEPGVLRDPLARSSFDRDPDRVFDELEDRDLADADADAGAPETGGTAPAGTATSARPARGPGPRTRGHRPHIDVTVPWSTLIGLDDGPADLAGYGPVTADVARRIAADPTAVWRRLLVDPATGGLLDYGRTTYRPPADLAAFVVARDRTCRFPGCDRPADRCDLDHRVEYRPGSDVGGATSPDNLDPLCRHHHRAKHATFGHARDPDGSIWTTPRHLRYRKGDPDLRRGVLFDRPLGPPPF